LNALSRFARFALPRVDSREGRAPGATSSSALVAFARACALSLLQAAFRGFFRATRRGVFFALLVRCSSLRACSAFVAMLTSVSDE
jgi:hypothetical protein